MAYLTQQQRQSSSETGEFHIPLKRAEMAEYLSVQHAALSRELSGLKKDGVIYFSNNRFVIK
jgi:CRP-like cAMP-binding protein